MFFPLIIVSENLIMHYVNDFARFTLGVRVRT